MNNSNQVNETNKSNVIESIVTLAIILVVIHTFLEDFSILMGFGKGFRETLMILGFVFDLFFTIEFLIRLYYAFAEGRASKYFVHEKGWIDFLASVPLLMFNSGPMMAAYILGGSVIAGLGGILNMLKLIKAIRIARILRLLRILKVFRKIKYADSKMAQRHVSKIITIGISGLVFTLFIVNSVIDGFDAAGVHRAKEAQLENIVQVVQTHPGDLSVVGPLGEIFVVKNEGKTIYTRYSQNYYDSFVGENDYGYKKAGNMEIFFDLRDYNRFWENIQAKDSLIFFIVVLLLVTAYLVIYSPHFALTVSDPLYVMRKGFEDPKYNLNVKIPEQYEEDDVFQLSKVYNEVYLPMKDRNMEESSSTELDLADFQDILNPVEPSDPEDEEF